MSLSIHDVQLSVTVYDRVVPKLWNQTIQAHRREVRDAILDSSAALVAERGLLAVTMSQIAERTGIGRATLYKYFPDVEAILIAWHDRHVSDHLAQLASARDRTTDPGSRLAAVLETYAFIVHGQTRRHQSAELTGLVHKHEHVTHAQRELDALVTEVLTAAAQAGFVRADVAPSELANFCRHALAAAGDLPSKAAVRRLVTLTLTALRPDASLDI